MVAAYIIHGILILLFVGLGILFSRGKGLDLVAGYNTASEKEKAKYDEKKLLKIIRNGMFAFAGCIALALIGTAARSRLLTYGAFTLFLIAAVVLVVRANTAAKK